MPALPDDSDATPPPPPGSLLADPLALARFTRAVLEENGFDYRDQETHTGVAPSLVYNLAQGQRVPVQTIAQFAAVAVLKARKPETRLFWQGVADSLVPEAAPATAEAVLRAETEEATLLFTALRLPQSRHTVLRLMAMLREIEIAGETNGSGDTDTGSAPQTP